MNKNDQIILDEVLAQKQAEVAPDKALSDFFEIYTAEQILKDYDLSYEEIENGVVGNGGDGGIDSFYVFINGDVVTDDYDFGSLKKNIFIEVCIIQSKTSGSFSESVIDKFNSSFAELFDLSTDLDALKTVYNKSLIAAASRFRAAQKNYAAKFPTLEFRFYYASRGCEIHPNVARKVEPLKSCVLDRFQNAKFDFQFINARKLLELASRQAKTTYELKLAENAISSGGNVAFVCIVKLKDFYSFITDKSGSIARHIFEANVRDYQGETQVNGQIQTTLKNPKQEDFWWLNNGVTVLATQATQSGKTISIENPEIVNGLQTSNEIYTYFQSNPTLDDDRTVLVRVIVPKVSESRDRIIRATNSQTNIPLASLRATDAIHRDIENFLKPYGLFYDRRKNFYKNEGKPIGSIVSIPQLAQSVMAIVLKRPDSARARPSSLIKKDEEYDKIFNPKYPINLYLSCARIIKAVEGFLVMNSPYQATDRYNLKFYVALAAVRIELDKFKIKVDDIAGLPDQPVSFESIGSAFYLVANIYEEMGASDKVAKSSIFSSKIIQALESKLATDDYIPQELELDFGSSNL